MSEELATFTDAKAAGFDTYTSNEYITKSDFGLGGIFPTPETLNGYANNEIIAIVDLVLPFYQSSFYINVMTMAMSNFSYAFVSGLLDPGTGYYGLGTTYIVLGLNTFNLPLAVHKGVRGKSSVSDGDSISIFGWDSNQWIIKASFTIRDGQTVNVNL